MIIVIIVMMVVGNNNQNSKTNQTLWMNRVGRMMTTEICFCILDNRKWNKLAKWNLLCVIFNDDDDDDRGKNEDEWKLFFCCQKLFYYLTQDWAEKKIKPNTITTEWVKNIFPSCIFATTTMAVKINFGSNKANTHVQFESHNGIFSFFSAVEETGENCHYDDCHYYRLSSIIVIPQREKLVFFVRIRISFLIFSHFIAWSIPALMMIFLVKFVRIWKLT